VSECDREALIMMRIWPSRGCCAMEQKNVYYGYLSLYTGVLSDIKFGLLIKFFLSNSYLNFSGCASVMEIPKSVL
jgi:hypothetical protein